MSDFPWLTTLGVVPLVGAVAVAVLPKGRELLAKQLAFAVSLVVLALTVAMAFQFDPSSTAQFQFVEQRSWIPAFGISYGLGVDGIALVLIGLAAVVVPPVILAGWDDGDGSRHRPQSFFAWVLVLEGVVIYVFSATDLFVFYVAFEVMLIPAYFLIGMFGGPQRSYAAVKFLLYSLFGGLVMLVALIGLYVVSARDLGAGTFDFTALSQLSISPTTQRWLFAGFFFAFAVKAPMVPFHTWLPDAAAEATPGTSTLLIGVLDKVGTFGMIRLCLPLFPDASQWAAPVVVAAAVVGVVYAGLVAIGQNDLKRLFAYSSVSHFGFMVLGIFAFTQQGLAGATVYMVAHGLSTAALFLAGGYMFRRRGSSLITSFGGVQRIAPVLAGSYLLAGLSALALPGTVNFVGELVTLIGAYQRYPVAAVVAVTGIVLAALYVLVPYKRVAQGPADDAVSGWRDMVPREAVAIAPVLGLIVLFGFLPRPLFEAVNPAVDRTLAAVGAPVPAPSVSSAAGRPSGPSLEGALK